MKLQLIVTTDSGATATITVEASAKAYAYYQHVLTNAMTEIFREEANSLPHAGREHAMSEARPIEEPKKR